jgi:hypothetical protein
VGDYPVYLRNMKLTETDISKFYTTDEVETTVTVTGAADGRVVLDETSTTAPDVANGVDVRVKRTINAGEWSTICLPFAMSQAQCQAAFGSDVQIGDFTGCTVVDDNVSVNFSDVTAMEANHPYLIKVANAITAEEGFTVDGVDIAPEAEPTKQVGTTKKTRGYFYGTYVANTTVPECNLFISNDRFYYSNGSTKMKAFRGYFELYDYLSSLDEAGARITMIDSDATGIAEMKKLRNGENERFYDLSGRRVVQPVKGLYITNNKKVIIK